jgi:hypothetical protein
MRIREGEPLPTGSRGQKDGGGRGRLAHADGGDVGSDVLHGVVDPQEGRARAPRGVDVEVDVLLWVLGLEVKQLGGHQVGHGVVDGGAQEHDPVLEQPGVDVEGSLAPAGLLDDDGNQRV